MPSLECYEAELTVGVGAFFYRVAAAICKGKGAARVHHSVPRGGMSDQVGVVAGDAVDALLARSIELALAHYHAVYEPTGWPKPVVAEALEVREYSGGFIESRYGGTCSHHVLYVNCSYTDVKTDNPYPDDATVKQLEAALDAAMAQDVGEGKADGE